VLGTLIGVMVAAHAIEAVGEVHATLVWGGIRVALITTVTGVLVLAPAAALPPARSGLIPEFWL
jgi:biopolymer transport protein ExbB/TolQ